MVAQGRDPKQEREEFKNRITFADFVAEHYLPHAKIHKRSVNVDESKLKIYLIPKFGHEPLVDMTTQALQGYHNQLRVTLSPATANRHLSLLHRIFSLAVQWGYCEKNPASGINKFQENNQHQRFLNNDEIRRLFDAADVDDNVYAAA